MTANTSDAAVTHNEIIDDFLVYEKPTRPPVDLEQELFHSLCYRALEKNEDGRALMVELNKLLLRPSWIPGQDKDTAVFAEGEKNIIRYLGDCIQRFKQPRGASV